MTYLIGVDEAGYGPNLGPLCIGATAWKVKSAAGSGEWGVAEPDLYELLAEVVSQSTAKGKVAIADSKQLYKPASHSKGGVGLKYLELGVLSSLACVSNFHGSSIAVVEGLFARTQGDKLNQRRAIPWYECSNERLPIDAKPQAVDDATCRLRRKMEANKIELSDMRARLVYPKEFNSLVEKYETKGAALSHVTLTLVREICDSLTNKTAHYPVPSAYFITCDKHGGRNRYAALLQHHFPEHWIETELESRRESRYRWQSETNQVRMSFRSKGESFLPAALASMIAKYHRELAMRSFNAYWQKQVPGIKPTAGYPQDAKRFKAEIAAKQRELGIDDRLLWRNR